MTKIEMMQVYSRIESSNRDLIVSALKNKNTEITYNFNNFKMDVMKGGFISSEVTIKKKWDIAALDQIIIKLGQEKYGRGFVYIPYLLKVLRLEKKYENKNVSLFYISEQTEKQSASIIEDGGAE